MFSETEECKGCGFAIEPHYFVGNPSEFCGRCYRTLTKLSAHWREQVEETRHLKHIAFCKVYAAQFAHGAPGHIDMLIVAKLANLLDSPGEALNG